MHHILDVHTHLSITFSIIFIGQCFQMSAHIGGDKLEEKIVQGSVLVEKDLKKANDFRRAIEKAKIWNHIAQFPIICPSW